MKNLFEKMDVERILAKIPWDTVETSKEQFEKAFAELKDVWAMQTWRGMVAGKLVLTDVFINEQLAKLTADNAEINGAAVKSGADGSIAICIDHKLEGRILCIGKISLLKHNRDMSVLQFQMEDRRYLDRAWIMQVVSQVGLALISNTFGLFKTVDCVKGVRIILDGNTINVDFCDLLKQSTVGRIRFFGDLLLHRVVIEGATARRDEVELQVSLHMDDRVKNVLRKVLTLGDTFKKERQA